MFSMSTVNHNDIVWFSQTMLETIGFWREKLSHHIKDTYPLEPF